MKAVELVCSSCGVRMRLKTALMERIWGHAGRVTCKACGTKIELDARSGELLVLAEGRLTEIVKAETFMSESERGLPPVQAGERTEFGQAELEAEASPHFSQYPDLRASIAPTNESSAAVAAPFVEEEAPESGMISSRLPEVQLSMAPPLPEELKQRRAWAQNHVLSSEPLESEPLESEPLPSDARPPALEAPVPPLQDASDSLTPHTWGDEDQSEILRLPPDFKSSPMSSNARDESFRSLFPDAGQVHSSEEESELARANRLRSPRPPTEGLTQPQALSSVRPLPDETRDESRKSNWAPWTLASVATLGLIFNVMMGPRDRGLSGAIYGALGLGSNLPSESTAPASESATPSSAEPAVPPPVMELEGDDLAADPKEGDRALSEAREPKKDDQALPSRELSSASLSSATAHPPARAPALTSPAPETKPTVPAPEIVEEEQPSAPELSPFSPAAAAQAIRGAAEQASSCRRAGDPSGLAKITVTFAASGRVTQALVSGPPFAGTQTGSCIAATFRRATVAPFSGERVTLMKTVTIR